MAELKIRPLADRVIVEPSSADEKTAGGIIIPDTAKEKPQKGIIVAVGPGTSDVKLTVKVGDVFAIEPFATDGQGKVISGKGSNIYLCQDSIRAKFVRDHRAKVTYSKLRSKFKTLPFAQRWVESLFPNSESLLRKLCFHGLLKHYPQLIEAKAGIVTQKEHTVIVTDNGCEVTT